MSTKVRVYEVARDLGIDNKALVALFQSVGVPEVKNHMSAVGPEAVERVKRHLEKQPAQICTCTPEPATGWLPFRRFWTMSHGAVIWT